MSTFIIAEAGVNHNGSLDLAKQLIEVAAEAGADAIKFQTFRAESLVSRKAPKAAYQMLTTGSTESQFDMIKRLELDEATHEALLTHCRQVGIQFLSTPFDPESAEMLVHRFDLPRLKLPSGEITNAPFLIRAAGTQRPIILSTGMSTLGEVEAALGALAFGYTAGEKSPSRAGFLEAYASPEGQRALREKVTLLHCTTEYPTPYRDVNLRAMDTLRSAFGLSVGLSDHTAGITIPIAAVARGATVIEKHFTLDRNLPGPDHQASLERAELTAMIAAIRQVEQALGSPIKQPAPCELGNLHVARKSLVSARRIQQGERFDPESLAIKRPGTGASPFQFWDWLGKVAERTYEADEVIS